MAGRTFLDTSVFIYAVDQSVPDKQKRAQEILLSTAGITISTQVLNEFYSAVTRRLKPAMPPPLAATAVETMARYLCVPTDAELVVRAIRSGQRWHLSHWDALVVEAARQAGCTRLFSEDLATGASYGGVTIENPFANG
ncbi:PIN domain-containing protein [Natronosporangium hydrolyticum]|uniref:Ribonuclease VapC n=1 Tax=Natronosporangium hydrolyticum TaxID=2811111 RepID=A0A895YLC8_9ACTN|nr:PIN domain-containing protein [Natronosporangium hydrolyticum]QSB16113.1 PIN domain-containing protein [Natronosporangium hydrolyticum]